MSDDVALPVSENRAVSDDVAMMLENRADVYRSVPLKLDCESVSDNDSLVVEYGTELVIFKLEYKTVSASAAVRVLFTTTLDREASGTAPVEIKDIA